LTCVSGETTLPGQHMPPAPGAETIHTLAAGKTLDTNAIGGIVEVVYGIPE